MQALTTMGMKRGRLAQPAVEARWPCPHAAPDTAPDQIATVVAALVAAPQASALLSGYHDETGGAAVNAEVAKNRALSVRQALIAAGVSAERVLMRRPAVTLGSADAAEARRVEVRVQ